MIILKGGGFLNRPPILLVLPEIVWVLGRTWVVPKEIPSFVRRGVGR
jgi:hypothetical protein